MNFARKLFRKFSAVNGFCSPNQTVSPQAGRRPRKRLRRRNATAAHARTSRRPYENPQLFCRTPRKRMKQGIFVHMHACMHAMQRDIAAAHRSQPARLATASRGDEWSATGFFRRTTPTRDFVASADAECTPPTPRAATATTPSRPARGTGERRDRACRASHSAVHLHRSMRARTPETTTAAQGGRRRSTRERKTQWSSFSISSS